MKYKKDKTLTINIDGEPYKINIVSTNESKNTDDYSPMTT